MFSAYTIKKVLPRLIIAAIAIQLSWTLAILAIQITNDVAHGIQGLIYAPFGGSDAMNIKNIIATGANGGVNAGTFTGTGIFAAVAAGGAFFVAGASSLAGILALATTAALGVLIALFTLILRQAVLIGLLVTVPIAVAAWVLPGTQKLWKMWWESFSKLLLMFPIIMVLIAGGRLFAYVAANMDINQFAQFAMIILGCFGPLFLIPATLKASGAAFGAITGALNNRGKGAFDRLRNVRANEAKKVWNKSRNYQRFGSGNALTRGMSTAMGAIANPRDIARGKAGIRSGRQTGMTNLGAETWKSDATIQANQNDDTFLLALANEKLARDKLKKDEADYKAALASGDQQAAAKARASMDARQRGLDAAGRVASRNSSSTRMAAAMALSKTGYQFSHGSQGYAELAATMKSITGGDQGAFSAAMNEAQYHLKGAGRGDLGGINNGAGGDPGIVRDGIKSGIKKFSNYQRGQGKTDTYKGGAEAWLGVGSTDGDITAGIQQALASGATTHDSVMEWHSMLYADRAGATDANKAEIDKQLAAIEALAPSDAAPETMTADQVRLRQQMDANRAAAQRGVPLDPSQMS